MFGGLGLTNSTAAEETLLTPDLPEVLETGSSIGSSLGLIVAAIFVLLFAWHSHYVLKKDREKNKKNEPKDFKDLATIPRVKPNVEPNEWYNAYDGAKQALVAQVPAPVFTGLDMFMRYGMKIIHARNVPKLVERFVGIPAFLSPVAAYIATPVGYYLAVYTVFSFLQDPTKGLTAYLSQKPDLLYKVVIGPAMQGLTSDMSNEKNPILSMLASSMPENLIKLAQELRKKGVKIRKQLKNWIPLLPYVPSYLYAHINDVRYQIYGWQHIDPESKVVQESVRSAQAWVGKRYADNFEPIVTQTCVLLSSMMQYLIGKERYDAKIKPKLTTGNTFILNASTMIMGFMRDNVLPRALPWIGETFGASDEKYFTLYDEKKDKDLLKKPDVLINLLEKNFTPKEIMEKANDVNVWDVLRDQLGQYIQSRNIKKAKHLRDVMEGHKGGFKEFKKFFTEKRYAHYFFDKEGRACLSKAQLRELVQEKFLGHEHSTSRAKASSTLFAEKKLGEAWLERVNKLDVKDTQGAIALIRSYNETVENDVSLKMHKDLILDLAPELLFYAGSDEAALRKEIDTLCAQSRPKI